MILILHMIGNPEWQKPLIVLWMLIVHCTDVGPFYIKDTHICSLLDALEWPVDIVFFIYCLYCAFIAEVEREPLHGNKLMWVFFLFTLRIKKKLPDCPRLVYMEECVDTGWTWQPLLWEMVTRTCLAWKCLWIIKVDSYTYSCHIKHFFLWLSQ